MKHIPTFDQFVNESYNRTQNKYKTQNVEWDDIAPGDYIADGPNVGEVSRVISNTKKGFTLKRVWNNVRKKDGEEFFVPHDLDAMKDYPNSIIKIINYVDESLNEALAAVDKSKLTNRVKITVEIARTLMNNARNGKLKHMSAPDGVTHYWNPKTKEYVGRTDQEGRLNQGTFFFSDALDREGNLTESLVNEGLKFNDSNGNPNAISREILGYVEKGLPAKILSAVESVEPNGYNAMSSPATVTNKGQARGVRDYQTITLLIKEGGIGKSKISAITVGIVKRTSGPGTGYIAIKANHYQGSSPGHILLDTTPNFSVAKEFSDWGDGGGPAERLKQLFDEVLAKHV
jgi:hypothetical protein